MKKKKKKRKGFTLIELLVVVAVVGLLSTIIIISVRSSKAKARDAERVTNISNIVSALALYSTLFNAYPIYTGIIDGSDALSTALVNALTISSVPSDPLSQNSSACAPIGGYHYYYDSVDGSNFIIEYCLETNSISGKSAGPHYVVP